jgi:vacuolar-type H+-ATPase subunit E/Vma4
MAAPNQNSPEVLNGEILAEARRQCDEILHHAQQEAEVLLAAAKVEADKIRREKMDAVRAEVARQKELMQATLPVAAGRLRSARIETLLEDIRAAARQQLQTHPFDDHETIVALAVEAIRRMPGTDFVLKISPADLLLCGDKLAGEIGQRAGRAALNLTLSADPALTGGDVMVQDADGLRIWDNRLLARLDRLWPELRRQIASRTALVEKNEPAGGAV